MKEFRLPMKHFPVSLPMLFLLLASLIVVSGCGYTSSGKWDNEPANWKRAFGESPPEGIQILNSWYMRTAHFTAEYAWFFKLKIDDKSRDRIKADTDFVKLHGLTVAEFEMRIYSDKPSWFPSTDISGYDIYQSKSQPNFLIILERDGNLSFWTSYQL